MKTCIITGAGSGIGQATAIELGRLGNFKNLVLIGKTEDKLKKTKSLLKTPSKVELIPYDLSDLNGIPKLIEYIYKMTSEINCLLNIAGYTDPQPLLYTSLDNIRITYEINVFAPLLLIRECTKYMQLNKKISKILNVSSTSGSTPRPGWLSYSSSKAALISISQTLSEELSKYNIRVYCISPGRCATPLRKKLDPYEDQSKIMQPEEVSHIICELISSKENCLDGQNIIIRKKL